MSYRIVNKGKSAELFIYGPIGGWFGGVTGAQVAADLKSMNSVDLINVRLNSEGGEVLEGFAIYNQLLRHRARIEVDIDGAACSIASIIACAGDHVRMARNAFYMIHEPSGGVYGTASRMREIAGVLEQTREQLVETYQKRTGLAADRISQYVAAETYFRASEAAELGFVDQVTDELQLAACVDLSRFTNVPDWVARRATVRPMPNLAARAARLQQNGF